MSKNNLEIELGLKELSPIEAFYENPSASTFKRIAKRDQTAEMVEFAVSVDGKCLKYVSKKLLTQELCEIAVNQNGNALRAVPNAFIKVEFYAIAVKTSGSILDLIPDRYLTDEMIVNGLKATPYAVCYLPKKRLNAKIINEVAICEPHILNNIPERMVSKKVAAQVVEKDPKAISCLPESKLTRELCTSAFERDVTVLCYVPERFITQDMCEKAFEHDLSMIAVIPKRFITKTMCVLITENHSDPMCLFEHFTKELRNDSDILSVLSNRVGADKILAWHHDIDVEIQNLKEHLQDVYDNGEKNEIREEIRLMEDLLLSNSAVQLLETMIKNQPEYECSIVPISCDLSPYMTEDCTMLVPYSTKPIYDISTDDALLVCHACYISDVHIEHQLKPILHNGLVSRDEIISFVMDKVSNMIPESANVLLLGGDIANTYSLESCFYACLREIWHGITISILGNHELWDQDFDGSRDEADVRTIDEIVDSHRAIIETNYEDDDVTNIANTMRRQTDNISNVLLHNSMFVIYKNRNTRVINEQQILNASVEDLRDICAKSSFIVLGGTGFSGCNQSFNANNGIYRSTVRTLEADRALTKRFRAVYDKILEAASDMRVIVFTHTPTHDWLDGVLNAAWIYVNGHTHQNTAKMDPNGAMILSDAQVGYKPREWQMKEICLDASYDPFADMNDGIHAIESSAYIDFLRGCNIYSSGCKYDGQIYVLKRGNIYMFCLKSKTSLCILNGGSRKKLDHDIQYYYDNMELYDAQVRRALTPYNTALHMLSNEVRMFGGDGYIHGCIVDIDFFCHLYLNPWDGQITPYYALDITSREVYTDLTAMLKQYCPELKDQYLSAKKTGVLPLLGHNNMNEIDLVESMQSASVPKIMFGTEIYEPSRFMKSMQYIFDSNTIRLWRDEILTAKFDSDFAVDCKTPRISSKNYMLSQDNSDGK